MSNQLTTQQQGWLRLAEIKTNLFNELQQHELACQLNLNNITQLDDLEIVQRHIKESKATMTEAKNKRLAFSRMLDEKLTAPAMEYEKRMAAAIETASKHELNLRLRAEKEAESAQAYNNEVAAFKAHVQNEWYRIAAEYRHTINQMINNCYTTLLRNHVDPKKVPDAIDDLIRVMHLEPVPAAEKFKRTLISDTQARELIAECRPFHKEGALQEIIKEIPERFAMYAHDLQNAEEAAKALEEQQAKIAAENAQKLAAEQATNILIAKAETATIDAPKVKRELKIVTENTESWAMAVVGNFLKNWQYCNKFVRVKSWEKLTIAQMADALAKHISETGEDLQGLKFEETCK